MKIEEILYTRENYDTRKTINRSDINISEDVLREIETQGITSERLDTLSVPVFKYKTQITIHGQFPSLRNSHVGNYKNIFQNQNKSIGIRYSAVDFVKRSKIYRICKMFDPEWKIIYNSTDHWLYKASPFFYNREECEKYMEEYKQKIEHIKKQLFFGGISVRLAKDPYFGYFVCCVAVVWAIYEKNVVPLIENICQSPMETIQKRIDEIEENKRIQQEKYDREWQEKIEKSRASRKTAMDNLDKAGFPVHENIPIKEGMITITTDSLYNQEAEYVYRKFSKPKGSRLFRYAEFRTKEIIGRDETEKLRFGDLGYKKTKRNSFEKVRIYYDPPITPTFSKDPVKIGNIEIVDYSDKAIAVIGDTKPIKDQLKEAGGRFNFRLSCGPGWIFPKTIRENVETLLASLKEQK